MNSRKQGDVGTSFAISYFTVNGYSVSIPLSDAQTYDLIAEKDGVCSRVQVKTAFKKNKFGAYVSELRTVSNTRGKKFSISKLSAETADLIFIVDGDMKMYLFTIDFLTNRSTITLNQGCVNNQVEINLGTFSQTVMAARC